MQHTAHYLCISPLPQFGKSIEAGSIIVAIESLDNLPISYVPFKPRAGLIKVVGSPLDGSNNWRIGGAQRVMVPSDVPRSAQYPSPRVFGMWIL